MSKKNRENMKILGGLLVGIAALFAVVVGAGKYLDVERELSQANIALAAAETREKLANARATNLATEIVKYEKMSAQLEMEMAEIQMELSLSKLDPKRRAEVEKILEQLKLDLDDLKKQYQDIIRHTLELEKQSPISEERMAHKIID